MVRGAVSSVIAISLVSKVLGHGKDAQIVPRLSQETWESIIPTVVPEAPGTGQAPLRVAVCFPGYTLFSDGTCVKEINEPAIPTSGKVTVPYTPVCPPGFSPDEYSACSRNRYVDAGYFCPKGFYDDGQFCASTIPSEVVETCSSGELVGGNCIQRDYEPYIVTPQCPEDSVAEDDGNCWRVVESFDCTTADGKPVVGRVVAPTRQTGVHLGSVVHMTKGGTAAPTHRFVGVTKRVGSLRALGTRNGGFDPLDGTRFHANRVDIRPGAKTRPHTVVFGTGELESTIQVPSAAPAKVVGGLTAGAVLNSVDGVVLGAVPVEPTTSPVNAINGNSAVIGSSLIPTINGEEACAKDLVAVAPPHPFKVEMISQICGKKVQVDALAIVSCPEHYIDIGTGCVREVVGVPALRCSNGANAVNGACAPSTTRIPKIFKCVSGDAPDANGRCLVVESIPGTKSCPSGFRDSGDGCTGEIATNDSGFECPEGLALVDDRCLGQSVRPSVVLNLNEGQENCEHKY